MYLRWRTAHKFQSKYLKNPAGEVHVVKVFINYLKFFQMTKTTVVLPMFFNDTWPICQHLFKFSGNEPAQTR